MREFAGFFDVFREWSRSLGISRLPLFKVFPAGFPKGSAIVFGEVDDVLPKHLAPTELARWFEKLLSLKISVITETDFGHLRDALSLGSGILFHAKINDPEPQELRDFARHCYPHIMGREIDEEGWLFCSTLDSARCSRAVVGEIKKKKMKEDLPLFQAVKATVEFFHDCLLEQSPSHPAHVWLNEQGISSEAVKEFKIGFAPADWYALPAALSQKNISLSDATSAQVLRTPSALSNGQTHAAMFRGMITFPVWTPHGPAAIAARNFDGSDLPKYIGPITSPILDKSCALFHHPDAAREIYEANEVIAVEGCLDVVAFHMAGIKNVVALMGNSLSESQAKRLRSLSENITFMFDGDQSGWSGICRAGDLLKRLGINAKVSWVFRNQNPKNLLRVMGADRLRSRLRKAIDLQALLESMPEARMPRTK